ncbi:MAG: TPM domain-containing protein, partial [Butyrivibrio sp.]|nr:TPM domain-containing protein [Butyrivibrio sp.]
MPHSSGGGSHSGGFHSSSSSSSSRSRSSKRTAPPPIYRDKPCRGYSRYAFYNGSRINYRYVRDTPQSAGLFFTYLVYVFFLLIGALIIYASINKVEKLNMDYAYGPGITDYIDILTDEEEEKLYETFEQFQEKTGISVGLLTDYNESWQDYYDSLENYAYDVYVNSYEDEKHWLIVYTEPKDINPEFSDWYWEGMQGDLTDLVLTGDTTDEFGEKLQRYLTSNNYTVGEAFNSAFMELTDSLIIGKTEYEPVGIIMGGGWIIFVIFGIIMTTQESINNRKKDKAAIEKAQSKGIKVE